MSLLCAGLFGPAQLQAASPVRVLVLPFTIHAETDLSFLQRGIQEMLSSRLTDADKVAVVDPQALQAALGKSAAPSDEAGALALAGRMGVQYLALGSLTVFGESISTDARFLDVAKRSALVTLNESSQNRGDVIQYVNRFADQVNSKVFGRQSAPPPPTQGAAATSAQGGDERRNPEELWYSQSGTRLDEAGASEAGGPGGTLWKSKRFGEVLKGIAVGDLDGDGRQETALLGEESLSVQRHNGQAMEKVIDIALPKGLRTLGIDAADINGNGRAELFVSAIRDNYRPSSYVLEWSPAKGQPVLTQQDLNWHLRVVYMPERKAHILLGQQGGTDQIFIGDIEELQWTGGGYTATGKLGAPAAANVYGVAFGDLMSNAQRQSVFLTRDDYLQLSAGSTEEWTSGEQYGGSYSFLVTPHDWEEATRVRRAADPMPESRQYLSQRLLVDDLNGDGKQELLVVRNDDGTNRIFTRVRVFRQGRFICLNWDNVGLTPKWRTRGFAGYISDYAWADIDNDGRKELAFVVVSSEKLLGLGSDKSYIVVWNSAEEQPPAASKTKQ